jgi:hypothetical protein
MRGCRRHQPSDLSCPVCSGRAARRTARAILSSHPRQLHAVKFETAFSPTEFHSWRIAARNLIDHQRRVSRWWRGVSLHCWLGADGRVRGIVALGSITPEECNEAFGRWEPDLRRIGPEEVAGVVLEVVRPGVVAMVDKGGYQAIRFTMMPKTVRRVIRPPVRYEPVTLIEAMPVLL